MKAILVPLDGSILAARALPYALRLAKATKTPLVLVRAAMARPYFEADLAAAQIAAVGQAEEELENAARSLRAEGADVETHVPYGPAAAEILQIARTAGADLIVMSTHGRGGLGRWIYGSVADRVLRRAEVPVLLVPARGAESWPSDAPLRVLVPLDGSELAEVAIEPAKQLAGILGASLALLRVIEPLAYRYGYTESLAMAGLVDPATEVADARRYLDGIAAGLRDKGLTVETYADVGAPASIISAYARELDVHAIAMATHGRSGVVRLLMGSVATGALQHATVPVLLVRPTGAPKAAAATAPAAAQPAPSPRPAVAGSSVTVTLSPRDVQMLHYGLELLLSTTERDEELTEPIYDLIDRLWTSTPARATATGQDGRA